MSSKIRAHPDYVKKAILIFPWSVVFWIIFESEKKAKKKGIGRPGIYEE